MSSRHELGFSLKEKRRRNQNRRDTKNYEGKPNAWSYEVNKLRMGIKST